MAEWLGSGLQSRVHGFDSRRRLEVDPTVPSGCAWSDVALWHACAVQNGVHWEPPGAVVDPGVSERQTRFEAGVALGGHPQAPEPAPAPRAWRDLVVATWLLVASVLTAVASLLSWRDYGPALDPDENGWQLADGAFGRGWVAVIVAVVLAVAGVLLVAHRRSAGRVWARVGSTALIVLPVVEWAFGDGDSRTGPGLGLWLMLIAGMVSMALIGSVLPTGAE